MTRNLIARTLVFCVASVLHVGIASATVIQLQDGTNGYDGTEDTFLERNSNNSPDLIRDQNFGGAPFLRTFNRSARDAATVIRFDLSPLLEAVEINSARLIMTTENQDFSSNPDNTIELFRVSNPDADWVVGTSNGAMEPGAATHDEKQQGIAGWSQGSLDAKTLFVGTNGLLSSINSMAADNAQNTFDLGGDLSFLIDWAKDPSENAGFMLVSRQGDAYLINNAFHSSEASTVAFRPILEIDFTPVPEPGSAVLLLLSLPLVARRRRQAAARS